MVKSIMVGLAFGLMLVLAIVISDRAHASSLTSEDFFNSPGYAQDYGPRFEDVDSALVTVYTADQKRHKFLLPSERFSGCCEWQAVTLERFEMQEVIAGYAGRVKDVQVTLLMADGNLRYFHFDWNREIYVERMLKR